MYNRILVAVDGSAASRQSLREAITLTVDQNAGLFPLNVVEEFLGGSMKLISRVVSLVSSALLAVGLAGCAAAPQKSDAHAHAGMGTMDMQSMCEMHKKMMSGKTSAEQQAMMQEHMKSMTPEMRQRMQAMHEQCK